MVYSLRSGLPSQLDLSFVSRSNVLSDDIGKKKRRDPTFVGEDDAVRFFPLASWRLSWDLRRADASTLGI